MMFGNCFRVLENNFVMFYKIKIYLKPKMFLILLKIIFIFNHLFLIISGTCIIIL